MSLFESLCNDVLEEMARPVRGGVGVPGSVLKEPVFAKKEKFGGQAGKYTGAQMLQYLGDFLKDRAESEMDYADLKTSVKNFLSAKGFKGTAAEYWTRTLSQTIFDFGYKPEKPSEVTENPAEAPEEFEASDVPEVQSSSSETSTEPSQDQSQESPKKEPTTPQFKSDDQKLEDDIYNYLKDGDEDLSEIVKYVSRSKIKADLAEWNKGNNILTPADKEMITNKVLTSKEKQVSSALEKLSKAGKVEKTEEDKYRAILPKKEEGEGSGEEPTLDIDDSESDDLDIINKYTPKPRGNPFLDSVDLSKIYLDTFKSKLD